MSIATRANVRSERPRPALPGLPTGAPQNRQKREPSGTAWRQWGHLKVPDAPVLAMTRPPPDGG